MSPPTHTHTHNDVTKTEGKLKTKVFGGGGMLEERKLLDGEVLSLQGDCICLALFISCFCFSSWWLDAKVFPLRPWQRQRAVSSFCLDLFLSLLPPPVFFFFVSLFLGEGERVSQNSAHSHATAASKIISLPLCVASISIHNADCS